MNIIVNGENKTISKSFSMVDLLNDIGLQDKQAIAIAINGEILQKKYHSEYILNEGDKVEIVHAIGGGC
ncbi:MAG: sulfur carrier protein ThiS [SAR202 cluster bacterium]|nr:thiamine biosynthesis protein ThiS [Chloroflexota bacterium]MQG22809.1 sulfur carrier protein ThiS [SAR202 cluster bacterium]|tara:strand:- start:14167 stop:14373 length:207 start_codon:yes stop_codon:yes gene_type:complete